MIAAATETPRGEGAHTVRACCRASLAGRVLRFLPYANFEMRLKAHELRLSCDIGNCPNPMPRLPVMPHTIANKHDVLRMLPYIVGVASLVVAAYEVGPSFKTVLHPLSDRNAKAAIFSRQVVNRSLKRDRLPIRDATYKAIEKEQRQVPARIVPNREIKIGRYVIV